MSALSHDLPDGMFEWVEDVAGGVITHLHRHPARREAWVVDVKRPDGSVLECFLRFERDKGNLERETRIVQALSRTDVPVPNVYAGWNADLRATLFERDPGRSDIDKLENSHQQRAVMEDFIRVVARFHRLDPDDLGIDDIMPARPKNDREAVLGEVDAVIDRWSHFLDGYVDPFTTYAIDWLYRFAPKQVARVSLVQGDTGPVNFMFQGDRVSSVIDWELGHWGDPLEDLGNICVREMWNPTVGLNGLFKLYSEESGVPYSRFAAQYYTVHQNVRGMVGIHWYSQNAYQREPLAWAICYRYVGDRTTIEMIAAAMEIAIERPEMPNDDAAPDVLALGATHSLERDVMPAIEDAFAAGRARDIAILIECIDRRQRHAAALEAIECDEIGALLGRTPGSAEEATAQLDAAIRDRRLEDEPLVKYLARRAYRDEWLYAPAAKLYPGRQWAEID